MKAILYPRFHGLRSLLASLTLGLLACMGAHAEFPDRTIKIIVPLSAGRYDRPAGQKPGAAFV